MLLQILPVTVNCNKYSNKDSRSRFGECQTSTGWFWSHSIPLFQTSCENLYCSLSGCIWL